MLCTDCLAALFLQQGNTEDRPARNPRAFDENNAVRLYDETKHILTQKVRMTTLFCLS